MEYITVEQASIKWKVSKRRVQFLCAQGRIIGAKRLGKIWLIPKNARKP